MGILRLQAMTSQKWHAFLFLINRMLWFYTGTSSQPSCNKTDTWHTNAKENWSESLNKRLLRNEEKTEYHSKVCLIHRQKKQNYFKLQINRKKKKSPSQQSLSAALSALNSQIFSHFPPRAHFLGPLTYPPFSLHPSCLCLSRVPWLQLLPGCSEGKTWCLGCRHQSSSEDLSPGFSWTWNACLHAHLSYSH